MQLEESVAAYVRRHGLLEAGERTVVGLSGGVDSVVLGEVLLVLGYGVVAVHVNYGLRGQASEGDETFVRKWCAERDVRLAVEAADPAALAGESGSSVQQAARTLRYAAFARVARKEGVATVALGHHRDDQAETVLLNLFRGTGPEGLAGMPVKRPLTPKSDITLVRPLLSASREEIESYARKRGLGWREDETNTKSIYRRGAVRSEILPLIERHFGASARENILRSADLMRDYVNATLKERLEEALGSALHELEGHGIILVDALTRMPGVVRRRVLLEAVRRWLPDVEATSSHTEEIDHLLDSQPGRRLKYTGGTIWRERDRLYFVPADEACAASTPTRLSADDEASIEGGTIRAERLDHPPRNLDSGSPNEVFVDGRAVGFPLLVRRWQPGDHFSPLGMEHSKKLSDFLTDEQVAPHAKASIHVVVSDGKIVWVVGRRISQEARVRADTKETVRLSFRPTQNSETSRS